MASLTEEERLLARRTFEKIDLDGSGALDQFELRKALENMGQSPTEQQVADLMADCDEGTGQISFPQFLRVMEKQKEDMAASEDADTLEAFVALGGAADRSGTVSADKLSQVVNDFGLTVDIDALVREIDVDGSGEIDYQEFKVLLTEPDGVGLAGGGAGGVGGAGGAAGGAAVGGLRR